MRRSGASSGRPDGLGGVKRYIYGCAADRGTPARQSVRLSEVLEACGKRDIIMTSTILRG
jgi:hypothetical protein